MERREVEVSLISRRSRPDQQQVASYAISGQSNLIVYHISASSDLYRVVSHLMSARVAYGRSVAFARRRARVRIPSAPLIESGSSAPQAETRSTRMAMSSRGFCSWKFRTAPSIRPAIVEASRAAEERRMVISRSSPKKVPSGDRASTTPSV